MSEKGERLIFIGAGGSDGWANYEIIQHSKNKQSNMDYHNDMDSHKFEQFLHDTCKILTEKYDKIAIVLGNANYHNTMHDDVPCSNWTLEKFKKYCSDNSLTVLPRYSKRPGKLVLKDYKECALKHSELVGNRYKADSIMAQYGIRCVRLPPYHPELNPIERV